MGIRIAALAGLACALGALSPARGATEIVLGDSHGVALAEVAKLKNFAHISVHIRGPKALDQIRRAPANVTAFVALGTNDADGSIAHLDKSIDDILDAAERKHMRLVWIGPPCVHKPWDTRARELDKILATRLAARGVAYVPMRDPALCTGGLHEPDGVHLKIKGYAYMWEKARRVAELGAPAARAIAAADAPASRQPAVTMPAARFELAAAPARNAGETGMDEPKIYVLRVKRHRATAQEY